MPFVRFTLPTVWICFAFFHCSTKKSRTAKFSEKTKKKRRVDATCRDEDHVEQEATETEAGGTESGVSIKNNSCNSNEEGYEEAVLQYPASSGEARSRLLRWLRPAADLSSDNMTSDRPRKQPEDHSPSSSPTSPSNERSRTANDSEAKRVKKNKREKMSPFHAKTVRAQRVMWKCTVIPS